MTHIYRDIYEYHDACYYCKYKNKTHSKSSTRPPTVCEECPRGMEGAHEDHTKKDRLESILQDYVYTNEEDWNQLHELKRLARIGAATEFAMRDGSKNTVFSNDIDYLLEFYDREKEV